MKKSLGSNLTNEDGNLLGLPSDFYYDVLKIEFDGREESSDDDRSDDGAHYIYEKMGNMILVEMNSEIKLVKMNSETDTKIHFKKSDTKINLKKQSLKKLLCWIV